MLKLPGVLTPFLFLLLAGFLAFAQLWEIFDSDTPSVKWKMETKLFYRNSCISKHVDLSHVKHSEACFF